MLSAFFHHNEYLKKSGNQLIKGEGFLWLMVLEVHLKDPLVVASLWQESTLWWKPRVEDPSH